MNDEEREGTANDRRDPNKSSLVIEKINATYSRVDQLFKIVAGNGDPKTGLVWKVEKALDWQKKCDTENARKATLIGSLGAGMIIALVVLIFNAGAVNNTVELQGEVLRRTVDEVDTLQQHKLVDV